MKIVNNAFFDKNLSLKLDESSFWQPFTGLRKDKIELGVYICMLLTFEEKRKKSFWNRKSSDFINALYPVYFKLHCRLSALQSKVFWTGSKDPKKLDKDIPITLCWRNWPWECLTGVCSECLHCECNYKDPCVTRYCTQCVMFIFLLRIYESNRFWISSVSFSPLLVIFIVYIK